MNLCLFIESSRPQKAGRELAEDGTWNQGTEYSVEYEISLNNEMELATQWQATLPLHYLEDKAVHLKKGEKPLPVSKGIGFEDGGAMVGWWLTSRQGLDSLGAVFCVFSGQD